MSEQLIEWDKKCRERGAPYCDWCGHAAVWSEQGGWHHSVAEHRFGLPRHLEAEYGIPDPGHEVSARAWALGR